MWLGHDLTWWGAMLGLVALLLMLPANLVANFLTPVLKDWWATRSIASLKRRINKMENTLVQVEAIPPFSPYEHCIVYGISQLGRLVMSVGSLIVGLVIILSIWYEIAGGVMPNVVFGALFLLTITRIVIHARMNALLDAPLTTGTLKGREKITASIVKLKERLSQRTPTPRAFQ